MTTTPQTIEKKYVRLKWITIISSSFLILISFMFFIYAWVQRQSAIKNEIVSVEIARKSFEVEHKLQKEIQAAEENLKACAKLKCK